MTLLSALFVLAVVCTASAQVVSEVFSGSARLIVADVTATDPSLKAIELPSLNYTHKVCLPGVPSGIGLSQSHEYLGVFRAHAGNNQHFITYVQTGLKSVRGYLAKEDVDVVPGSLRRMTVSKTLMLVNGSDVTGGAGDGQLDYHPTWGVNMMYSETHGLIVTYDADNAANPNKAFTTAATMHVPPGHFDLTAINQYVIASHTTGNLALLLDKSGHLTTFPCNACHGIAVYSASKTKGVAVFGSNTSLLVVTIKDNKRASEPKLNIKYLPAANPRIGSLNTGASGVFWTAAQVVNSTDGPFFYRTDVRGRPSLTKVNHSGSSLAGDAGFIARTLGVPEKRRFLCIHRVGLLVMYNGVSGKAVGSLQLSEAGFPAGTPSPQMITYGDNTLFVSVPATGNVHEINVNYATGVMSMGRVVNVGGTPGVMAVAEQKVLIQAQSGHHHHHNHAHSKHGH